jgi:hypothetical protein
MEVDRSLDNIPFNGINYDENDNENDDEENENNEILFEPEVQLGRPIRQRNIPQRYLPTPDTPPPIRNNRRNLRIIDDGDENELIDNFILENRNNNLINVSLHDAAQHYQRYARQNPITALWYWPFASNHRFMHYIQDMDERHRIQSQASIYLSSSQT